MPRDPFQSIPAVKMNMKNRVKIKIGEIEFQIFRKTKRCAATEVNPQNGIRDIKVPNLLYKIYGHSDLGVYGIVLNKGLIKIGDEIKI